MVHLRIVAPAGAAGRALELLKADGSVTNVVYLANAAQKPDGDLILCDVAREDASVVVADLKNLDIPKYGSITLEYIEAQLSEAGERAEEHAPGLPSDAVVWEDVESRTSEETELSASFLAFMVVAMQIAAVGTGPEPVRHRAGGRHHALPPATAVPQPPRGAPTDGAAAKALGAGGRELAGRPR